MVFTSHSDWFFIVTQLFIEVFLSSCTDGLCCDKCCWCIKLVWVVMIRGDFSKSSLLCLAFAPLCSEWCPLQDKMRVSWYWGDFVIPFTRCTCFEVFQKVIVIDCMASAGPSVLILHKSLQQLF